LTNLIFNAIDAMPMGGRLTLRTPALSGCEDHDKPASAACIEVADTGVGMDDETRHRCLEPFFTTKDKRGSGLGLAMVYGMIQRHSAELEVESEPDKGTTVRLVFSTAAVTAAATEPRNPHPDPTSACGCSLMTSHS
jgi:signal transduction histidine kinase